HHPLTVAASDAGVFWISRSDTFMFCPLSGCRSAIDPTVLAASSSTVGLLLAGNQIYWSDAVDGGSDEIYTCSVNECDGAGGPPVARVEGRLSSMALSADAIFWAEADRLVGLAR